MVYRFIIQKRYHNLLKILSQAKERTSHDISKEVSMTTAHLSRVISQLSSEGILTREEKDGRSIKIKLTKKGVEILFLFDSIEKTMSKKTEEPEIKTKLTEE